VDGLPRDITVTRTKCDDKSEPIVVEPRFRLFTDPAYRAGHFRNYR
jgi:hypothetical protein